MAATAFSKLEAIGIRPARLGAGSAGAAKRTQRIQLWREWRSS